MFKLTSAVFLIVILFSIFASTFKIQPAKASSSPTIYIMPDGTVNGTSSIQTSNNSTYVFTADIVNQSIAVQRNNTLIDGMGHVLQGSHANFSYGMDLSYTRNVTVQNIQIQAFDYGILASHSSYTWIDSNNIKNNSYGIYFNSSSFYAGITGCPRFNNITANNYGIMLNSSSDNQLSANIIENNSVGIYVVSNSTRNIIMANNITANNYGIMFNSSSGNEIYWNMFVGNTIQASCLQSREGWFSSAYLQGNYWSDYLTRYPNATEIGSSGIWSIEYIIDANNNLDLYPLVGKPQDIPEFQPFMLLPLFMMVTLLSVAIYRKKLSETCLNVT